MKYLSRKFIIVLLLTLATIAALFVGKLVGSEFVTMSGILIGAFTAGDIAINWIHKDKKNPDAGQ